MNSPVATRETVNRDGSTAKLVVCEVHNNHPNSATLETAMISVESLFADQYPFSIARSIFARRTRVGSFIVAGPIHKSHADVSRGLPPCTRTRIRQWSRILTAVSGLLVLHATVAWWPVHINSQRRTVLEAQYNPLRQMKATNKRLARQIAGTLDQSKLELALSKQIPVLTLVGLVSQAIADSDGKVFLEQIVYTQNAETGPTTAGSPAQLALEGFCTDPDAVKQLAESLRSALPFADVNLKPIRSIEVNQHPMQTFQIVCSF